MKVRVLRPFLGESGKVIQEGTIIDVPELRAKEMETNKTGVPLVGRLGEGAATDGAVRPTKAPQTGGRTGEAKPVSSSRQARVQPKPASKPSRGRRG